MNQRAVDHNFHQVRSAEIRSEHRTPKLETVKITYFVQRLVFSTITSKMNLSDDVDLEDFVARPDKISGADIHSICQEAGK